MSDRERIAREVASEGDTTDASKPEVTDASEPEAADASKPEVTDASEPEAAEFAIDASGLTHAFGDVAVFDDLSLSVSPGEIVALVGPNGSGKTTLLQFLTKVRAPDEGTVAVGVGDRTRVGYLPQQPEFREGFTAADTLRFYAQFVEEDVDIGDTLDRVGLSGAMDRRVEALSGGMTRLLGLGRALIGDPAVLILDEPASGLDPGMVERLFEIVSDLADEGVAVILSSHNLGPVERTADRVVILDGGEFVATGSPKELVDSVEAADLQTAFGRLVSTDEVDGR
ncbi:ABC transporter ATP-binding protein [Haloferax sp. S1W]|uniref:ABC transporter ATP-binding protein n=1 Tax=Haloferax sp. S1W TaxID=3377110 RepID=UPI0037C631C3